MSDQEQTPLGTTRGAIQESRRSADQRTPAGSSDPNWTGSTQRPEGVEPRGPSSAETQADAFGGNPGASNSGSASNTMLDQVKEQTDKVVDTATKSMSTMADQATSAADMGMERAAGGLDSLAGTIRDKSQSLGAGQMESIATSTADKLESGAEMLRGQSADELIAELEALVRRKPVESLLVAAGVGFILSRAFR